MVVEDRMSVPPLPAEPGSPSWPQCLRRPFRAIVFDWDGTAVSGRDEHPDALAGLIGELQRLKVWVVVVTGTNAGHLDRQLLRLLPATRRRYLLLCTNRGSEVYGFDRRGALVRRWLRQSTPAEEQALTAVAEGVRDALAAQAELEVGIVYDRLNRRKIDLIPVEEWADPPKSRIGELLAAVEARLAGAGYPGGLAGAIDLARGLAREHGLADARVTSDVKHIEVGLTDKGDALAWLTRHLLHPRRIPLRDVLIAGDEFGPIAGFAGSDDRLRTGAGDAVVVSVGREPNGVPEGVIHLGGGPVRFRALLADQIRLRRQPAAGRRGTRARDRDDDGDDWTDAALQPPAESAWRLEEQEFRPALEHAVEARFAVGNGLLGVRGSVGLPTPYSQPRTFVAGLFDTLPGEFPMPVLAPGPDWLRLSISADGIPLAVSSSAQATAHPRILDERRGVLLSSWQVRDAAGRIGRARALRFASQADRRLAAQMVQFEVDRPMWLSLEAWPEAPVRGLVRERTEGDLSIWRTEHADSVLAIASRPELHIGGRRVPGIAGPDGRWTWGWAAMPDEPALLTRLVAVARGDDGGAPSDDALRALRTARAAGLPHLLAAHARAWSKRWRASDVVIDGDDSAQQALRFAVYHLVSAANPDDERVSIGARALTGDAYAGHVFWDTEIFLLPFYTLTWPAAARALLLYRYHTLPAARAKAARLGYRGALYAWESAGTGEEATPPYVIGPDGKVISIRCGVEEHHISADVAHAVWQYWQATRDDAFLLDAGAEILLETARFWASRAAPEADGRYHIRGVIGPDEYHEGVDDNAFTNEMARWNLARGRETAALLAARWPERWNALRERLAITPSELDAWGQVEERLAGEYDAGTGLFEQFAGFFDLKPVDLAAYEPRSAPMDVILGPEQTRQSQVVKQADVLMLLALLGDRYPRAVQLANFLYYEPRCGHGSSLSPAVHALVAARLGDVDLAERYFHQAAAIDLDDRMGNAAGGVHIAALGGLWQAVVFGFAGLSLLPDGLRFDPHLPETWQRLAFTVQWRGRAVRITLERAPLILTAALLEGEPLAMDVAGLTHELRAECPWTCRWDRRAREWKETAP